MRDRSLDEFLNVGDGDPTDGKPSDGPDDGKPGDEPDAGQSGDGPNDGTSGDGPNDGTSGDGPNDGTSGDGPDDGKRETDVDPVTATYAWDPDGGTCARCGTTVGRRWRGEAGLVCDDCKEW